MFLKCDQSMDFIVAGREEIESGIVVRAPYVVISITDPGKRPARIQRAAGFRDILRLQFHDAVPLVGFTLPSEIVLMTKDHARSIYRFVKLWHDKVETIVVHCEQGMSRSPAVAAAICKVLDGDSRHFFHEYMPNRYIYQLMLRSGREVNGVPADTAT